jgi:hypothetical protein
VAAIGDVFPFWSLFGLYFIATGPCVLVVQFSKPLDSSSLLLHLQWLVPDS